MKQLLIPFLFLLAVVPEVSGKIHLPSVFSDNMVLQQNSQVAIWGWADAGENIKIVPGWNTKDTLKVKVSNDAKWSTTIKTKVAGGPYTLEILGSSKVKLQNVMLGEVWICSGQSNMEWNVTMGIKDGVAEAANASNDNIRIFRTAKVGADYPQHDCNANWEVSSPESMRKTSALGYFFARELQKKLNVPVGIIVSAWGGTPIEVWIEKGRIENNPVLNKAKYNEKYDWWPSAPGTLYNSMIYPVVPFGIAGAIWYQGESNCINHPVYASLMKTMIENWRADFKKDFPFYFVQIAPFNYGAKDPSWYLREQQELAAKSIPNTGMVVISDLVDDVKNIHPKNKQDVGKRLANYALAETYHQAIDAYKSPMYKSMQILKSKIRLNFDNVLTGLKSTGKTPSQFLIADENKQFIPATAKIEGSTIVISAKEIKNPAAVRFCFDNSSMPDVFSTEGLPLAPFRTDSW